MSGNLKNRVRLSITLTPDTAARVRKLAEDRRETISAVIERLIDSQLAEAELMTQLSRDPLTEAVIEQLMRPENIERAARIVGQKTGGGDVIDAIQAREQAIKRAAEGKHSEVEK